MIKPFSDWLKGNKKPILLLGKGPSFSKRKNLLLSKYTTITLNHAIREQKATIAHLIDFDVFEDCQDSIYANCEILVVPWCPHIKFRGTAKTLNDFTKELPVLKKMVDEGRVYTYNLSTGHVTAKEFGDQIRSGFFSGDTIFSMLTAFGEKEVFALGIDGKVSYDPSFSDLTPFTGGHTTFDKQFDSITRFEHANKAKFINLGLTEPLEIFVGATEKQLIPTLVLDYTIKKHTDKLTEVVPLYTREIEHEAPKLPRNGPRTPFSFQRFWIPSLTKRVSMYLDSDMMVFGDIAKVFKMPFNDSDVLAVGRLDAEGWKTSDYAMLLLDGNINWDIHQIVKMLDSGELTYESLMFDFEICDVNKSIDSCWNCLDKYTEGETKLLHFTNMQNQPWLKHGHPLESLWVGQLHDAINCGFIDKDLVLEHEEKFYIRGGLV